jgi:hypothetical protein
MCSAVKLLESYWKQEQYPWNAPWNHMRVLRTTTRHSVQHGRSIVSKLTSDERKALIALGIFPERPGKVCDDCGGYHLRPACPRIKREVKLGNGNRTEVEYWQYGCWDESCVIYAEDVYDEEESDDA